MTPGMPSTKHAMEPHVRQAMDGLLAFDSKQRWTLETLTECEWVKTPGENSNEWHRPSPNSVDCRETLQLFQSAHPLPTALAVNITARNHSHLINQPLGKLDLGKKLGVMVLLVRRVNGSFERVPGAETKIERGDWMYFGVPQGQEFTKAVDGLESLLHRSDQCDKTERDSARFRTLSKKDVFEAGKLVEFSVEFDCFTFPQHIGQQVEVGPNGLNLRSRFGINLVGIERHKENQDAELEWFPRGDATVRPGDFGLVSREPCADGSSRPTLTDEDLEPLMNSGLFRKM
jgi:Trk K+ transport system NAD-binding subunit